ncbi:DUF4054 domain-containing protein [Tropicimonas sp. IMCC34011]|uniref:DUF4054 domain-containing protein n=1 Tax=Tropicimonas sp. IMCC34011 TaxID=2248759 RepID=UPI000E258A11|nr:DUF4054 domain-containing protein [Tropicimonas sp. IMCC34011]
MAYVMPTAGDLIDRFPEFEGICASLLTAVVNEAVLEVGEAWGEYRKTATLYLAAHILAEEGGKEREDTAKGKGKVTSVTVGNETTTWGPSGGGVVAYQVGRDFTATPYGRRYMQIKRRLFAGSVFAV